MAVEANPEAVTLGEDFVLIPAISMDLQLLRIGLLQDSPASLLVEKAPPALGRVGLIPADGPVVVVAAKLTPAVSLISDQPNF